MVKDMNIGRAIDQIRTNPQVRRDFDQHAQLSKRLPRVRHHWWTKSGGVTIGIFMTGGNVRLHEPFKDRQFGLWPEGSVPAKITLCSVLAAYWM